MIVKRFCLTSLIVRTRRYSSLNRLENLRSQLKGTKEVDDGLMNIVGGDAEILNHSLPGSGRLPEWLKSPIPKGQKFTLLKKTLRELNLHTVRYDILAMMTNARNRFVKRPNVPILEIVGMEASMRLPRRR